MSAYTFSLLGLSTLLNLIRTRSIRLPSPLGVFYLSFFTSHRVDFVIVLSTVKVARQS